MGRWGLNCRVRIWYDYLTAAMCWERWALLSGSLVFAQAPSVAPSCSSNHSEWLSRASGMSFDLPFQPLLLLLILTLKLLPLPNPLRASLSLSLRPAVFLPGMLLPGCLQLTKNLAHSSRVSSSAPSPTKPSLRAPVLLHSYSPGSSIALFLRVLALWHRLPTCLISPPRLWLLKGRDLLHLYPHGAQHTPQSPQQCL